MDKLIEYCKENTTLVLILGAIVLLALISIIALAVKKSKGKQSDPAPQVEPVKAEKIEVKMEMAKEKTAVEKRTPPTAAPEKEVSLKSVKESPAKTKESIKTNSRYSGKWKIYRVALIDENGKDANGEESFFFELRASNGEKLFASEEYTSYSGAVSGIATHKANVEKGNFKITLTKKGDYIFKLLNGKNMLLCMGEHYATRARCESAIQSTKRFSATAVLEEKVEDILIPYSSEEEIDSPVDENEHGKWVIRSNSLDGEEVFYFELIASNGERLLSSEEYTTYVGAVNGITTHKNNIEKDHFRVSFTKQGDYIFKLLNGNGQLLCLGEHYATRGRCESAIQSVKRFAGKASVLADSKFLKQE